MEADRVTEQPAEQELFEFVVYLISCARLSLEEPPIYGSFRLVEGASRLIEMALRLGIALDKPLDQVRLSIEREKLRLIDDEAGYTQWLGNLLRDVAGEAKKRNLKLPE